MATWKHALVTGAGSGLGLGFSVRLLQGACRISALDLALGEHARRQLDEAAAQGQVPWQFEPADVTDETGTCSAVDAAIEAFGAPDLVIHCAGVMINRAFADMSGEAFRRVVDVNLNGSFHVAQAVIPHLRAGARLALLASIAGLTSNYAYTAYGASKFGVVGLATTLRYEYEPRGIHISCVCPPEVKTPMVVAERAPGNADPISLALKDTAGSLELDAAVDEILRQLDAGRWLIIPGTRARLTAWAARHTPAAFFAVMQAMIRREMRRHGPPPD